MSRLALFLLGSPHIELDGAPVHIGRSKAIALLAYLALEGGRPRRDALAALLWPEYDHSRARADLRRTLSQLNRALGAGWLAADRESAGIDPERELWLDVDAFRRCLAKAQADARVHSPTTACPRCLPHLEEAVALYRGDFMAGFTLRDSLDFDEWQFFQTQSLRDGLALALGRLVAWHRTQGEHDRAIEYARRWLALDPAHEPAHRQLMALHAQAGQPAAALRQYDLCQGILADELGLPPAPETTALVERIRAGEEILPDHHGVAVPHNLPPQPTRFVGREAELAGLDRLIADAKTRLVTIVGAGGIGKTRLALAAAERQLRADAPLVSGRDHEPPFPHGVFFVPLERIDAPEQIVPSVAEALGFTFGAGGGPERDTRPPRQQLLDYLREKRMLLLMDNLEHLLDGLDIIADILRTAPHVQVLATSRESLPLYEEQAYPIQGLAFPDHEGADAAEYAAAHLFLQASHRIRPGFELGADDLAPLARVCRLFEGMPLALELAAGWVDTLSLPDIADELGKGLDLLETEWQDVPARHRSVRAAFDTTWRRLSAREQDVFCRLCVFRGGFTRQAAREVAGADLRTLARLVDKSLLRFSERRGRYELHELLRQHGIEKLARDPQREAAVHDRHSAVFCAALQAWGADLGGTRRSAALAAIDADLVNVWTAWQWAASQGHVERLDQALGGLCDFFYVVGRFQEGDAACKLVIDALHPAATTAAQRLLASAMAWRSWLNIYLADSERAQELVQASQPLLDGLAAAGQDIRYVRALLHRVQGRLARPNWNAVSRHYEQSVALYRELGSQREMTQMLLDLGQIRLWDGKPDQAREDVQKSLALARAREDHSGAVWALILLNMLSRFTGDYTGATRQLDEGLALARSHGDDLGAAECLRHLGYLALFLGDFKAGADYLRESAAISRESGRRVSLVDDLACLSAAYWFCGDFDQAYVLIEESVTIAEGTEARFMLGFCEGHRAWLDVAAGRYAEARARAERCLRFTPWTSPFWMNIAIPQGVIAWAALAQEDYAAAIAPLHQAIAAIQASCQHESFEYTAWSLAALGRAECGLGNRVEAERHLLEALRIVVEIRAFIPLLHLMPVIPLLLADAEDPSLKERAVELYAMATGHPFVARAQLFEDIAGRYIRAATVDLSADVIAVAQARGRALDWWPTAETLLEELRALG
jgi:DNA-binding SARP family transcriptional activator/predicted ATPase